MMCLLICLEEETYCPVSYIRIVAHLEDHKDRYCGSIAIMPRDLQKALERLPDVSLVIMARNRMQESLHVAQRAAELGIPILYDIDDHVWRYPDYSKLADVERVHTDDIIALASEISTPSDPLKQEISGRHPDRRVTIVPNAGNIWSGAAPAFVPTVIANSDFFRLPEMRRDFFQALRDAAASANQPILLYYLSNDPPDTFTDDPYLRILWLGFRSYSSYKQLIDYIRPVWAFVPLRDETFSRYKSVIKFAEYAFSETLGIYSDVPPYQGYIEDGVNGLLAANTYAAWRDTVLRALQMDKEERLSMLLRATDQARSEFDHGRIQAEFVKLLDHHKKPGSSPTPFENEIPDHAPFVFREAYAYIDWKAHHESAALQRENQDLRTELAKLQNKRDSAPARSQWIERLRLILGSRLRR
jgi:hypothetical protein